MERMLLAGLVVLLVTAAMPGFVGGPVSEANEPPLVEAGLDQRVTEGARVRLDGGGTRDPDGRIVRYRWTIRTPNGSVVTPACATCVRTWFRAADTGIYTVTLSATDDDGATRTDTLYVTVLGSDGDPDPPAVTLSGPNSSSLGSAVTFTANLTRGSADLARVVWHIGGTKLPATALSSAESRLMLEHTFRQPGAVEVTVTLVDEANRTATATHRIVVTENGPGSSGAGRGAGGGGGGGGGGAGATGLRATILGPSHREPGEGAKYEVVLHNTDSGEGYDSFAFSWSNVNGSAGLPHGIAYREFPGDVGTKVKIEVLVVEKVGEETVRAAKTVYIANDTDDVEWGVNTKRPEPKISGPDIVTACDPTTVTFSATDTRSGIGPEYESATSFEYRWENVDSSTDRWAAKKVEADPGERKTVDVTSIIVKNIGDNVGEGDELKSGTSSTNVEVVCPARQDSHYVEYHWTKPGETKQVNATTAPTEGAEKLKRTYQTVSWVADTTINRSTRWGVADSFDYHLRRTVRITYMSDDLKLAASSPGPNWKLVEKNAERKLVSSGQLWSDTNRPKPDWADQWKLVDVRAEDPCDQPGQGRSGCIGVERDYKFAYKKYKRVDRWQRRVTEWYYIYQKRARTTWYLWEYETKPEGMTTRYDPRTMDIEIEGAVRKHRHSCERTSNSTRNQRCRSKKALV